MKNRIAYFMSGLILPALLFGRLNAGTNAEPMVMPDQTETEVSENLTNTTLSYWFCRISDYKSFGFSRSIDSKEKMSTEAGKGGISDPVVFWTVSSALHVNAVLHPGQTTFPQDDTLSVSSHFVFPEFILGKVKMKNGITEAALLNYNVLTEEMIFESDSQRLALVKIENIDTVYIESRKFVPHNKVFYEVLIDDTVSLFVRHKRNILSSGSPSGYGGTTETGAAHSISHLVNSGNIYNLELSSDYHLTDASQFWITMHNSSFRITSERQILKLFPEISGDLKKFIIDNHLNIKKQRDLTLLIARCNEMLF